MDSDSGVDENRKKIISIFIEKVQGKKSEIDEFTATHNGKKGYWLEEQMGIEHDARNEPDLLEHELKDDTTGKTSFGDWSADYYIFKNNEYNTFKGMDNSAARDKFMKIFGQPSPRQEGKYCWSGKPIPKINEVNSFGEKLVIDESNNVVIKYFFSKDSREDKQTLIPSEFQKDDLLIVRWDSDSLRSKVENKFNQMGWFKCMKNSDDVYDSIVFGDPMNYETWLGHVADGNIFFDSGMIQGNSRNYSQWRASNSFWMKLVVSRYP